MADPLGEFELLVLLTVRAEGRDGYGGAIQLGLAIHARREVALGTIAKTLRRLEAKGMVRSRLGDPRAQRGGRTRVQYEVTPAGVAAVDRALRSIAKLVRAARRATATGGHAEAASSRSRAISRSQPSAA